MQLSQWAPTIITVIAVIFGAGAIWDRVSKHETRLNGHDTKIAEHDVAIAVAVAFRQGYESGKDVRLGGGHK